MLADTRWPEGALAALVAARAAGLPAVLDADRPVPADGALLRAATHVAFSSDALADLTGIGDASLALAEVARGLQGWCCVTAGGDGVYSYEQGEIRHDPAFDVPVVDTLGAGDVWHGAFALALAEGTPRDGGGTFCVGGRGPEGTAQRWPRRGSNPRRTRVFPRGAARGVSLA